MGIVCYWRALVIFPQREEELYCVVLLIKWNNAWTRVNYLVKLPLCQKGCKMQQARVICLSHSCLPANVVTVWKVVNSDPLYMPRMIDRRPPTASSFGNWFPKLYCFFLFLYSQGSKSSKTGSKRSSAWGDQVPEKMAQPFCNSLWLAAFVFTVEVCIPSIAMASRRSCGRWHLPHAFEGLCGR